MILNVPSFLILVELSMNSQKVTLQPSVGNEEEEENLIEAEENETKFEEYHRHRKIAKESCDLGRKYLKENDYMMASKEFSKAVMTFEFMLKNNLRMKDFKGEVTSMMKEIILPAYSNLSLCYLKLKNWGLVISMADQVLQSDANNVKNLYRRGIARKERKMYHEAVEDFEKVAHLDKEMNDECSQFIKECRELRKLAKKQEKKLASSFIGGYAS